MFSSIIVGVDVYDCCEILLLRDNGASTIGTDWRLVGLTLDVSEIVCNETSEASGKLVTSLGVYVDSAGGGVFCTGSKRLRLATTGTDEVTVLIFAAELAVFITGGGGGAFFLRPAVVRLIVDFDCPVIFDKFPVLLLRSTLLLLNVLPLVLVVMLLVCMTVDLGRRGSVV